MRQINPFMAAAHRSGEPEDKAAASKKFLRYGQAACIEEKRYRLHYGETPVGMCVTAHPMEINAWNVNARAFYAHQITLGRTSLPILEWREVGQDTAALVWRVRYKLNGAEQEMMVSAMSKTAAKREAEKMLCVAAVIHSVEQGVDITADVEAIRAANGATDDAEEDQS